jgi:hypothetical protein
MKYFLFLISFFFVTPVFAETNIFNNTSLVSCSSSYVLSPCINSVDGNTTDDNAHDWVSNGETPATWHYDTGSSIYAVDKLTIYAQVNPAIHDFTFSGSNDDSSWTTLLTNTTALTPSLSDDFIFTNTVAYRYYRVIITSNDRGNSYSGFIEINGFDNNVSDSGTGEATSSATLSATSTLISYRDWLSVNLWIIFFLAIIAGSFFFQLFDVKKKHL